MPPMSRRILQLAAIATLAGAFSGLFGVGGGTIIVPLLVLWLGYEEREATGTSLAAIGVIAALGAGLHGVYGNVDPLKGIIIGAPALVGVVAGIAVQRRVSPATISGVFAVLLIASTVALVL